MRSVPSATRQCGSSAVEYALLIAVVSISLVLALPALGDGFCELSNRVGALLGSASAACAGGGPTNGRGNNGGANNDGSNNNGGANNPGGGTNLGGGNGNGNR